jgi:hypothetical protein
MKALLQRKCDGGGGCCSDCDRKKLQREAIGPSPQRVPPIVHDVLRSSGQPLDHGTRAAMESQFDHDFSNVRLHRDERAAKSADAVGARAYTVGANVVLGRDTNRDTLAHELAHTIQQEGATYGGDLEIGRADDPLEHDADGMARGRSAQTLRRAPQPQGQAQPAPAPTEQHAGQPLSLIDMIMASVWVGTTVGAGKLNVDADTTEREKAAPPTTAAPRFILHDTDSAVSEQGIKGQLQANRGPLGKGVNAWVPKKDPATITRPFFETQRPTTTEFEKGLQFFLTDAERAAGGKLNADMLKGRRDARFRAIWALVDPIFHGLIVSAALSGKKLTAKELKGEREGKTEGDKKIPGVFKQLRDPKTETFTTASWAIELIVNYASNLFLAFLIAAENKTTQLNNAALALAPYFALRDQLIAETINVEMVQPHGGATDKLSYSAEQYDNVRALYLRAATAALVFPSVTTHKLVDEKFKGGHDDPRCFNLGKFYDHIATALGHNVGPSRYGVEPTYGRSGDGTSISWPAVCAEKKPK